MLLFGSIEPSGISSLVVVIAIAVRIAIGKSNR